MDTTLRGYLKRKESAMDKTISLIRIIRSHAASLVRAIADLFDEPHDPTYDDDIIEKMYRDREQAAAMRSMMEREVK